MKTFHFFNELKMIKFQDLFKFVPSNLKKLFNLKVHSLVEDFNNVLYKISPDQYFAVLFP
jgi:hypothetical protein